MAVRLSALRAGYPLPLGIFLVLISVRGWVDPKAIVWLEGLSKLKKKFNDLVGTRTRDLLICSIVPQPTTLSRAPHLSKRDSNRTLHFISCSSLSWEAPSFRLTMIYSPFVKPESSWHYSQKPRYWKLSWASWIIHSLTHRCHMIHFNIRFQFTLLFTMGYNLSRFREKLLPISHFP
jgi:hypothetical protein